MKKHLVMLHGFGCDSRVFSSIGAKLSKDLDVLMVDIPGHGQTKEEFGDFSFSAYNILFALDNYLKEPYTLLGWSMGGQIALEMYKQLKRRCETGDERCDHNHGHIESLILISSTPKFVASEDFPAGMNKAVFNKFKKGINEHCDKSMDVFYKLIFSNDEDCTKYIDELKKQVPSQATLSACMKSFEKFDESNILPKISIPTLIMTGDSDGIIGTKASMYISQEIKGGKIKIFKGAGHAPHLTREEEVIGEIRQFIR